MKMPKVWRRNGKGQFYVTIKQVQTPLGTTDEVEANAKAADLIKRGHVESDPTVYNLLNLYLDYAKEKQVPTGFDRTRRHLKRFVDAFGRTLRVSQLKVHNVTKVIEGEKYKDCSSTYQNDAITALKAAFNWAVKRQYIDRNPIDKMEKPPRNVRETFVQGVDWQRVLDAATDQCFLDYLIVAFSTGARPQEMRMMTAAYLDGRRVVFPRLKSKGRKRQRVIYLDDTAFEIVERLAAQYSTGPIFRNRKGEPWKKDAIKDRFMRLAKKLDMPGLCAYSLRHSYAHHKVTTGVDTMLVSKLLGHSDGRMLMERYGHLDKAEALLAAVNQRTSPLKVSATSEAEPGTAQETDRRQSA